MTVRSSDTLIILWPWLVIGMLGLCQYKIQGESCTKPPDEFIELLRNLLLYFIVHNVLLFDLGQVVSKSTYPWRYRSLQRKHKRKQRTEHKIYGYSSKSLDVKMTANSCQLLIQINK